MNQQADWHYFFQPRDKNKSPESLNCSRPYGDLLLSPYPIECEMSIGGTLVSPSRPFQPTPPLIGHVSLLSPDSSHDSAPRVNPRTHYLGEAIKIGLTFVSGYEFRVARHTTNIVATVHWHSPNQHALAAAASEYFLCGAGITANAKNPPTEEKQAHSRSLDYVTGLLRNESLSDNVRQAFLNAMETLHIAISCAQDNPGLAVSLSVASIEAGADCFFGSDRSRLFNDNEREELEVAANFTQGLREKHGGMISKEDYKFISKLSKVMKTLYQERFYTKRKFLIFSEEHAPYHTWDALARHPYLEIPGGHGLIKPQSPFSAMPSQMHEDELRALLEETYGFRNKYVHCARQPAALASPSLDTYFETFFDWDTGCERRAIKPALLIGIARKALVGWLEQSVPQSRPSEQAASSV